MYGKALELSHECRQCKGPIAEPMRNCPWCGVTCVFAGVSKTFPRSCPRCRRGIKADWNYCSWCYGGGFERETSRRYADVRYTSDCSNSTCERGDLMPFMRYCPWCRTKTLKKWKLPGSKETCGECGWGVCRDFWSHCPWCGDALDRKRKAKR